MSQRMKRGRRENDESGTTARWHEGCSENRRETARKEIGRGRRPRGWATATVALKGVDSLRPCLLAPATSHHTRVKKATGWMEVDGATGRTVLRREGSEWIGKEEGARRTSLDHV